MFPQHEIILSCNKLCCVPFIWVNLSKKSACITKISDLCAHMWRVEWTCNHKYYYKTLKKTDLFVEPHHKTETWKSTKISQALMKHFTLFCRSRCSGKHPDKHGFPCVLNWRSYDCQINYTFLYCLHAGGVRVMAAAWTVKAAMLIWRLTSSQAFAGSAEFWMSNKAS